MAPDGTRADSAVFSILGQEWPAVQQQLQRRLAPFALAGDLTDRTDYARRTFAAL